LKQEGRVFGFSSPQYALGWAEKHNKDKIYQFSTKKYVMDEKTYDRPLGGKTTDFNDNEYIAVEVNRENQVSERDLKYRQALQLVQKLNQHAFQPIKDVEFAAKLISERIDLNNPLFNYLSNDRQSGKLFSPIEGLDPTWGVFFVDIFFLRSRKGNVVSQSGSFKSVDAIKDVIKSGKKLSSIPGYELRDGVVGEGNHRIEALYQLGYLSVPVQIWGGW
jgi:hypothetical protein